MSVTISDDAADAMIDAVSGLLDGGGYIEIRTGSKPATVATAASGTLLGTLNLSSDAFADAASRSAAANTITGDSSADASGTAGYFRAYASGGVAVLDGTVGESGEDLNLDSTSIVEGGTINITSLTLNL
jgi:hypothetical protein